MEPVLSRDPRTGEVRAQVGVEADTAAVDAAVRAAYATLDALADRQKRSALLRAAADGVESRAAELIAAADAETALGVPRLTGELARVAYQFRFFADIVDEGAFLGVVVDEPDPSAVPPRPALRRWKVPIGVVGVFAASNFPFAFSVPGGDTASALAAGCPVVVKAHPDHPQTSEFVADTLRTAAEKVGFPADVLTLIHGMVQPQPSDPGRRPAGQDGAQDAATNAAEGAGEQAPALPRRRRGSSGQPRRPRSPGGQLDRAALLRLLRPGSTGADEDSN